MAQTIAAGVVRGMAAGAVGKVALDVVTYLDMLGRGRPPSDLPERAATQAAGRVGIDLAGDGRAAHRRTAVAALMGYASGVAMGGAYGMARASVDRPTGWMPAGVLAGLAAMAGTAVPSTLSGLTDPRRWGVTGWLEDLFPHLAYGLATALAYEALS